MDDDEKNYKPYTPSRLQVRSSAEETFEASRLFRSDTVSINTAIISFRPPITTFDHPSQSTSCSAALFPSNNHLGNTLASQRLAAHKLVFPQRRDGVKRCRDEQHNGGGDQARRLLRGQRQPLHRAHAQVDGRARVVCREPADEAVEFVGRGADAQEERDFDEEYDQ